LEEQVVDAQPVAPLETRPLRFAIAIPQFVADGAFDPAGFRAFLARAEALGFASAWTQEQVLGAGTPVLDPIVAMTYAAACTERLRLGCAVFVTPIHNPVHLAKSLSTLDQASGGRLEIGVGTGAGGRAFPAFGVDPESLVARFTEGLRLMRALWTEPRVTFHGRFWQLDDATMEPKPVQKPHPPLWFGARHPAALRRAARLGDGFFGAGSSTTAQFAEQVRVVRAALAGQGRDPAGFRIAKRVYVVVDDDVERARRRAAAGLERIYGRGGLEAWAVFGPPDACVRGLREVADAGAELIQLNPFFDPAEQLEQLERLAAEVLPEVS
jgi:probable F420-dependent oxidoreductase